METTGTAFTIQEAAKETGLTEYTLRYYERIGLLMPIERAANGHRRYSPQNIDFIQTLNRWRLTGMPLADIQRYVKLVPQGDATVGERRALLEAHRQTVLAQIEELQATLQIIDFKIQNYTEIEQQQEKIFA